MEIQNSSSGLTIHCGACMTYFEKNEELYTHIDKCPAVKTLLPFVNKVYQGGDPTGHAMSHLLKCIHNNSELIKRYVYCVVDRVESSMARSEIHDRLCRELDINYNDFRPFESEDIKTWPSREEGLRIFWNAMEDVLEEKSKPIKERTKYERYKIT